MQAPTFNTGSFPVMMVIVIIAGLYGAWFIMKKRGLLPVRSSRILSVTERIALGKGTGLILVRANGHDILLGVSPTGISTLRDFSGESFTPLVNNTDFKEKIIEFPNPSDRLRA
jgi:flagellar biogenesis protein FliO